jgi:hypothetical protein
MSFCFFSKTENRKVKQVLFGGWYQWEEEDISRRVNVVEYYVLMYENGKMRPIGTISGTGLGG